MCVWYIYIEAIGRVVARCVEYLAKFAKLPVQLRFFTGVKKF